MAPNMPTALDYRMPAEWELHLATWLAWPHNPITWPDQLPQVQDIFLRMIAALHRAAGCAASPIRQHPGVDATDPQAG